MPVANSNSIEILTAYRLLKQISKPWEEWEAYKLGLIDKNGKKIRNSKTDEEQKAMSLMKTLAANLKRVVQKVGGKSKMASLAAAMWLLREHLNLTDETIEFICEELDIDIESDEREEILSESVVFHDRLLRHVTKTDESFFGYAIYEGKDILSGKTMNFINVGVTEL